MQQGHQQVQTKSNAYKVNWSWLKLANLFAMMNRCGRMLPSGHLALVPCQGAMAGNVLVIGVGTISAGVCPRQHMRPGVGLDPTMALWLG